MVLVKPYTPDAGDIVWLEFNPQSGHEQAGHRPALVLSPSVYNEKTSLMLCVPLTTQVKAYPFEVPIEGSPKNVALADQIKSLDWRARNAKYKGKVSHKELKAVTEKSIALLGGLGQKILP